MRKIPWKYAETGTCAPKGTYSADPNMNASSDTE